MNKYQLEQAVRARIAAVDTALNKLSDEVAIEVIPLFKQWEPNHTYTINERLRDNDKLYRVVQTHTSQEDWRPADVPALYTEIAKPGEIPEWRQPTGAQDAYMTGDKVRYNDDIWQSTVDYNTWEPGVYGWDKEE